MLYLEQKQEDEENYQKYGIKQPDPSPRKHIEEVWQTIIDKDLDKETKITNFRKNNYKYWVQKNEDQQTNLHILIEKNKV